MKKSFYIIGLGYVGFSMALALADKRHTIYGYDADASKIEKLKNSLLPFYEDGCELLFNKNKSKLNFTAILDQQNTNVDYFMICVNTPALKNGRCDISRIISTIDEIIKVHKDATIIIKSTAEIGTSRLMQKYINDNHGENQVIFSPEFFSQGQALKGALQPDRVVLGGTNKKELELLSEIFSEFTKNILITDWESAELIKYASNSFLATKISAINEVSNLCEKIGANIKEVSLGIGMDSRIGKEFLNAGIGFGGSCFEKDLLALITFANMHKLDMKIFKQTLEINYVQYKYLLSNIKRILGSVKNKKLAVLGLSFKENTDDIRCSISIKVVHDLIKMKAKINLFDPLANNNFLTEYNTQLTNCQFFYSIDDCIRDCDAAVILSAWDVIKNYDHDNFVKFMKNPVIFDGRNCIAKSDKICYFGMGGHQ